MYDLINLYNYILHLLKKLNFFQKEAFLLIKTDNIIISFSFCEFEYFNISVRFIILMFSLIKRKIYVNL